MELEHLKILIVEDDRNTRATICHMLTELGIHQVYDAHDGDQARELIDIDIDMIDIIISDWNMPNVTGIDLLKHVRNLHPDIPFLMVTARGDIDSVKEAQVSGVTAYIRKPFSLRDLETKLKILAEKI